MIPRKEILSHEKAFKRSLQIDDIIHEISSSEWRVLSGVSGNTYTITETEQGLLCNCKAVRVCRHLVAAVVKTLRNPERRKVHAHEIQAGDRVLVSELSGFHWHTVTGRQGDYVQTREVPEGFRVVFIIRHERASSSRRSEAA